MKNYVLLGIGIGMIISGSIFTFFDNKEYSKLEAKIREEVVKEMSKEKIFDDIEEEFSSIVEEKKISSEEKSDEKKELEKIETKVEKVVEEEKKFEKQEDKNEEKQETKVALAKFYPLPGGENIYNIQFRSSSDKDDVIRVQKMLNPVIDTKIEFIQGYYRLFAKDLYSEEYAEMLVHEIKKAFSLNPIIRNPKQFDYLILGPKKYNEKYNIEEEKKEEINEKIEVEEKVIVSNDEKSELSKEENKKEIDLKEDNIKEKAETTSTQSKETEAVSEKTEITSDAALVVEEKSLEAQNKEEGTSENKLGQAVLTIDNVEAVEKVEADKVDEIVVENKNTKLIFIEDGSKNQMEFIKSNIQDLMELDIREVDGLYKIESKDYFSEVVADDLVSKLNLLFNLNITKDKK